VRFRAIPRSYGNGPATILDHFCMELGLLIHAPDIVAVRDNHSPAVSVSRTRVPGSRRHAISLNQLVVTVALVAMLAPLRHAEPD
jgi:hypothetical protein